MFRGFYSESPNYIPDNMHKKPIPPETVSLVKDNLDIILDKNGKKMKHIILHKRIRKM